MDGVSADQKGQNEWTPEGELNGLGIVAAGKGRQDERIQVGETESKLRNQKCVCRYALRGRK